jgi:hypothetical protein
MTDGNAGAGADPTALISGGINRWLMHELGRSALRTRRNCSPRPSEVRSGFVRLFVFHFWFI